MDLAAPIKGAATWQMGNLSLEQLIGACPVAFGVGHMVFDPSDLRFENFNSRNKLVDRQRAEVLLGNLGQRVGWLAGEQVVEIHGRQR